MIGTSAGSASAPGEQQYASVPQPAGMYPNNNIMSFVPAQSQIPAQQMFSNSQNKFAMPQGSNPTMLMNPLGTNGLSSSFAPNQFGMQYSAPGGYPMPQQVGQSQYSTMSYNDVNQTMQLQQQQLRVQQQQQQQQQQQRAHALAAAQQAQQLPSSQQQQQQQQAAYMQPQSATLPSNPAANAYGGINPQLANLDATQWAKLAAMRRAQGASANPNASLANGPAMTATRIARQQTASPAFPATSLPSGSPAGSINTTFPLRPNSAYSNSLSQSVRPATSNQYSQQQALPTAPGQYSQAPHARVQPGHAPSGFQGSVSQAAPSVPADAWNQYLEQQQPIQLKPPALKRPRRDSSNSIDQQNPGEPQMKRQHRSPIQTESAAHGQQGEHVLDQRQTSPAQAQADVGQLSPAVNQPLPPTAAAYQLQQQAEKARQEQRKAQLLALQQMTQSGQPSHMGTPMQSHRGPGGQQYSHGRQVVVNPSPQPGFQQAPPQSPALKNNSQPQLAQQAGYYPYAQQGASLGINPQTPQNMLPRKTDLNTGFLQGTALDPRLADHQLAASMNRSARSPSTSGDTPLPVVPALQPNPDRAGPEQWQKQYTDFMAATGHASKKLPSLGGRPLDMYSLFHLVVEAGGFEKVTADKKWKTLADKLGLTGGAPTSCKRHYVTFLQEFERALFPSLSAPQNQAEMYQARAQATYAPRASIPHPSYTNLGQHAGAGPYQTQQRQAMVHPQTQNPLLGLRPGIQQQHGVSGMPQQTMPIHQSQSQQQPQQQQQQLGPSQQQALLQQHAQQRQQLQLQQQQLQQQLENLQSRPNHQAQAQDHTPQQHRGSIQQLQNAVTAQSRNQSPYAPPQPKPPPEPPRKDDFKPITRQVISHGGLDLDEPISDGYEPVKELYSGKIELHRVEMALKSDIAVEMKWALDLLVVASAKNSGITIPLHSCPDIVGILCDLISTWIQPNLNEENTTESQGYKDLASLAREESLTLSDASPATLSPAQTTEERALAVGAILRNVSFTDSAESLATDPRVLRVLIDILKVSPIPHCRSEVILEQRKNALVMLSNLGSWIRFPDVPSCQLVMDLLSDFLDDVDFPYAYPALEALAKVTLAHQNAEMAAGTVRLGQLLERTLQALPVVTGLKLDATVEELATWEMASIAIHNLAQADDDAVRTRIVDTPGLVASLIRFSRPPRFEQVGFPSTGHHHQQHHPHVGRAASMAGTGSTASINERSMRTLVEIANTRSCKGALVRHEGELLTIVTTGVGNGEVERLAGEVLWSLHED
ncbi:hypothetical protein HKX48_001272 [Thoreauomyces humboldtii]|nr:hypothetical protein HKX48_001272 [Thoreauomyces humboldtii]